MTMSTGPDSARFDSSQNSPWMTEYERSSPSSPPQLVGRSSSGPASAAEPASSRSCVSSSAPASSGSKQLQRDAEREVRLELGPPRAQDRRPARPGPRDRRVEQRGLADARVALDEQQVSAAGAGGAEQLVDGAQLVLPLEEDIRLRAGGDWFAFGQKTGELP